MSPYQSHAPDEEANENVGMASREVGEDSASLYSEETDDDGVEGP